MRLSSVSSSAELLEASASLMALFSLGLPLPRPLPLALPRPLDAAAAEAVGLQFLLPAGLPLLRVAV